MEHPEFEGHVMPNEDEYKKFVQLKFRYCLGVSEFTVGLLITCILAPLKSATFAHFRLLWSWSCSGYTAYLIVYHS